MGTLALPFLVTDLRNSVPKLSVAVDVHGYSSAGDGGGGLFWYDPNSKLTDNGGTVIKTSVGCWLRIYTGPVSVKWFGAKGDGIANDTAAIQAAVDMCALDGHGTVYFPTGTYLIRSTIFFGDKTGARFTTINVIGDGAIYTKLLWGGPSVDTNPPTLACVATALWRDKYASFEGISIVNAGARGNSIGMLLSGPAIGTQTNGCDFKRVVVQGFSNGTQAGGGLLGSEAASELNFINCEWDSNDVGFDGSGSGNTLDLWFRGCQFTQNGYGLYGGTAGSIGVWGGSSHGNTIATFGCTTYQTVMTVEQHRFELVTPERAFSGSTVSLAIVSCLFLATDAGVFNYPSIDVVGPVTLRSCVWGYPSETQWKGVRLHASASVTAEGCKIGGDSMVYINPNNSDSHLGHYAITNCSTWAGTRIDGRGRVVWTAGVGALVDDVIKGTAIFASAGAVAVTFTGREDASYTVSLAPQANETFWITNKTATGFTLHSSNATSVASVDWILSR